MKGFHVRKHLKVMIAGAAVASVVAVAGIAYAAYARSGVGNATGRSEKFRAVTVTGEWGSTTGLLPGEKADVKVKVTISAENTVDAKVTGVVAAPITAGDIGNVAPSDKATCAGFLSTKQYAPTTVFLAPGASNVILTLKDAVTLGDAPIECEGMTFDTKWTVTFAPQRNALSPLGSGASADITA